MFSRSAIGFFIILFLVSILFGVLKIDSEGFFSPLMIVLIIVLSLSLLSIFMTVLESIRNYNREIVISTKFINEGSSKEQFPNVSLIYKTDSIRISRYTRKDIAIISVKNQTDIKDWKMYLSDFVEFKDVLSKHLKLEITKEA
jgi:hypothetical protein